MADKAISELIAANQVTPTDLFVLEQSGTAKKLTGQVLENWLVSFADGHGGIQSIVKNGTSGLVDTYRITLADTTTFDFIVTNGKSIETIAKESTSGLVDTYRIRFNDSTSQTYTITNGEKGDKGDNTYTWIKYASQKPTESSHSFGDVADNWIGIYFGSSSLAPTDWTQYEWFQIKGEKGDTGDPATVVSNVVEYQASDSGTIIPSGTWGSNIPTVAQGRYLWARTTTTFNTGSSAVSYSVSRMGIDGTGSVSSVASISPDANGNVPLTADDIGAVPAAGGDMTGELKMNGQPISGLNAPTENDQAANMGFVNQQVKKAAPRNLLDNSDFRNPVNQRRQTSLVANDSVYQYFIDRWCFVDWSGNDDGTLTLTADGISVTKEAAYFYQRSPLGSINTTKTHTVSIYYADGTIDVLTATHLVEKTDYIEFRFVVEVGKTVSKVALYEGEYTAETLPGYQPKGYEQELLVCRQYDPSTGEYIGLRKFSQPRNLLDNSDFRNPVNQRGLTSYTSDYGIDRWRIYAQNTSMVKADGYLTVTGQGIWQNVPNVGGKVYTLAGKKTDGTIYICSGKFENGVATPDGELVFNFAATGYHSVMIGAGDWLWVALYEGEYTFDTLPEYQPKGYTAELLECMQYFGVIKMSYSPCGFGYGNGTTQIKIFTPRPVNFRKNPSVTYSDGKSISDIKLSGSGADITPPSFFVTAEEGGVCFTFDCSGATNLASYVMRAKSSFNILLSADL